MSLDLFGAFGERKELRPHQVRAIEMLKRAVRVEQGQPKRRVVLQLPTGAGKTVLAARIIEGALGKDNRAAFLVPAISLIDQTVEAFASEGIRRVGVIQSDHPRTDPDQPVQVCSVQSLANRKFPDVQLVLVDECHIQHKATYRWMQQRPDLVFIGLSATPWTRGLGKHWDDLVVAATTRELIDAGYLSDYTVYAPSHPDLRGVKTTAGDYNQDQLSKVMRDSKLVGDVVDSWLKLGNADPTLVFAVDRAHARALQERFERSGIRMGYCDAYTDRIERKFLFSQMARGEIAGICNVGTLTTGVDEDVRTLVLARPTKSPSLFVQIVGRALRTAPGKVEATILDHTDTTLRLGLPCSITSDGLDDGKKGEGQSRDKAEPKKPTSCSSCGTVKAPGVRKCPKCGFQPEHVRDVEHGEGALVAVKPGKQRTFTREYKQRFLSGLITIQHLRGRSRGWVSHTYRDKIGTWPKGLDWVAGSPSQDVQNFVKHKDIAFAKARAKGAKANA